MEPLLLQGKLLGEWMGTNQLWLSPGERPHESKSTAFVSTAAQSQFINIAYTWAIENEPQDGLIICRSEIGEESSRSVWLDSWHMRNEIMLCKATMDEKGVVSLKGSYPAPPGTDWGWRIEIGHLDNSSFEIRMINITPEGQEALAVLSQYSMIE
jgi:hypothetical protein